MSTFERSQKAVDVESKSEERRGKYLYSQRTASGCDVKLSGPYARLMWFSYFDFDGIEGLYIPTCIEKVMVLEVAEKKDHGPRT